MSCLEKNVLKVSTQLTEAAEKAGRNKEKITLLAVSKTRPAEDIQTAYTAGLRQFGENYLQESLEKIQTLQGLDICWHFIGPLQSNKTRAVAENFDWIHTVDRLKIAQRLSDQRPAEKKPLNICIQVNISDEDSKSGCQPDEILSLAKQIATLPGVQLRGLMAIPKATESVAQQHQVFAEMNRLFLGLKAEFPTVDTLSMGMSGDMSAAIAEGSTMVRIGTAIFGPRNNSNATKSNEK